MSLVASHATAARIGAPAHVAAVRSWLYGVALLVFLMVLVGGATRLTDSGLSITEWQPILGAIPPMSDAAWAEAFDKYRRIPEYRLVNKGMSLEAFKFIYWWEWGHRFLGRFIGLAYFVPFVFFLAKGWFPKGQVHRLAGLFLIGGLQGAVGWWMVASGLVDRVDVAPYRLATHLTLACIIFAALVWTAESLEPGVARRPETRAVRAGAAALVGLVLVQIFLGGLVAGNDAGLVYNTWPSMNGAFLPDGPLALEPVWKNLFENHGTVQFVHRMTAYALVGLALWQAWAATRHSVVRDVRSTAIAAAVLLAGQAAVGILTLVWVVPMPLALTHQGLAVIVLGAAVLHLRAVRHRSVD